MRHRGGSAVAVSAAVRRAAGRGCPAATPERRRMQPWPRRPPGGPGPRPIAWRRARLRCRVDVARCAPLVVPGWTQAALSALLPGCAAAMPPVAPSAVLCALQIRKSLWTDSDVPRPASTEMTIGFISHPPSPLPRSGHRLSGGMAYCPVFSAPRGLMPGPPLLGALPRPTTHNRILSIQLIIISLRRGATLGRPIASWPPPPAHTSRLQ